MATINPFEKCIGDKIGVSGGLSCPANCTTQTYSVTVSTAAWPSLVYTVGSTGTF